MPIVYIADMPRIGSREVREENDVIPGMLMSRFPQWTAGAQILLGILGDCVECAS